MGILRKGKINTIQKIRWKYKDINYIQKVRWKLKDTNNIQKIRGLQDPPVCYVCAYQHLWREVALSSDII